MALTYKVSKTIDKDNTSGSIEIMFSKNNAKARVNLSAKYDGVDQTLVNKVSGAFGQIKILQVKHLLLRLQQQKL